MPFDFRRPRCDSETVKTKNLKINGESTTAVLVAGGPGFKIYSTPKVEGWVVAAGRQITVVQKDAPDFKTLSRYLTLPYQPKAEHNSIKDEFQIFLKAQTPTVIPQSESVN